MVTIWTSTISTIWVGIICLPHCECLKLSSSFNNTFGVFGNGLNYTNKKCEHVNHQRRKKKIDNKFEFFSLTRNTYK